MVEINKLLRQSKIDLRESILILSTLLNVDKSYIFTYGDKEIDDSIGEKFLNLVEKRSKGYPIHYILGEREFMGLDFIIEDGVLIPRPDTEVLVEYIIEYVEKGYKKNKLNILDIGFGSGAISLSLAYYLENAFVHGIDISPTAYKLARKNKEKLNISNVKFHLGDLFKALDGEEYKEFFQIITSNPPYIERDIIETLEVGVKDFEPRVALDGGEDGLDFYREITPSSKKYLKENGLLIYEIGYGQGQAVKDIMTFNGFKGVEIIKDLQKHDRVILGFK